MPKPQCITQHAPKILRIETTLLWNDSVVNCLITGDSQFNVLTLADPEYLDNTDGSYMGERFLRYEFPTEEDLVSFLVRSDKSVVLGRGGKVYSSSIRLGAAFRKYLGIRREEYKRSSTEEKESMLEKAFVSLRTRR